MSKFDEAIVLYKEQITKLNLGINDALITAVAKSLGPSIYNKDSSTVSASDKTEMDRVKNNLLIKKYGLTDSAELDAAVKATADKFGVGNRSKHRAIFYALLAKHFGKESLYV